MGNRALALLIASTVLLPVLVMNGSEQNLDVNSSSISQVEEGNITLENGRAEVLTISFDVDSTTDLHGLEITTFDVAGNSQTYIFDMLGVHSTGDSIVIPAWAAGNHSEAIEMFRTRIDSHPFFEASWQGESVLQIFSLLEGDLEEWVLNPSEGVATLSTIDGENPRVHPTIEEVLSIPVTEWNTYDGIRPTMGFQLSDEGSMIIAGRSAGWSNDESLLDCNLISKIGRDQQDNWGYFMVKFDSEGECVWLHQTQLYEIYDFWTIGESIIFNGRGFDSSLSILGQDIEYGASFIAGINPSGTYDFVMASPYPQDEYDPSSQYEIQDIDWYQHIGSVHLLSSKDGLIGFLHSSPQDATAVFSDCPPIHPGSLFKIGVDGSCEFVNEGVLPDSDGDGYYEFIWDYSFSLPDGNLVVFEGFYGGGTGLDWTPKIHVFNGSNGEVIRSLSDLKNESHSPSSMVTGSFPQHQFGFKPSSWQQVETPYTQCIGYNWNGDFERPLGISNSSILFRFTYKTSDSSPSECRPGIAIMNISNGDFTLFDEEQLGMHVSPQGHWEEGERDIYFASEVYPNGDGFCMVPKRTYHSYNNESPFLDEGFFWFSGYGRDTIGVSSLHGSCFNDIGEFSFAYSETMSEIPGFPEYSAWGQENRYYRSHDETLYILKKELRYNNSHQEQEFFLTILRVTPSEEVDFDGDSVLDLMDFCLETEYQAIVDGDGCSWDQRDDDGDGWLNPIEDGCQTDPSDSLSYPLDADGDLECDLKDDDDDGDGVLDEIDQFPFDAEESRDFDGDGVGDNSDPDDDGDGWDDETEISCYTDHLDSSSFPIDEDADGVCDSYQADGFDPESSLSYCGEYSVKTFLDSEGCTMVFQDVSEPGKKYSSVTSANSVSRGSNPTMQMAITPDGSVLAVLDDKSLLTLHFLDEGTSEWKIISEGESLAILRENGRIAIVSGSECTDVILETPCVTGWDNEFTSPGEGHHWSGPVYFSERYTPCKPGWTGLAHCNSGWFRIGDWNEFSSPSITGIVSQSPSFPPTQCPGCASPNGMYIADVAQIATDWELLGVMDMRRDIVVSRTETWTSGDGESSRPGGLATVVGGYNFGSCGSLVCMFSELGDGLMFDFGGFTWSGDSSYLYAATSDSIVTIDPEDGTYWEIDNDISCESSKSPSQFTGVSTPDGTRVVIPCGTKLIILDVERNEEEGGGFSWFDACCLLLIIVGLLVGGLSYFTGETGTNQASASLLIPMLLVMATLSGCMGSSVTDLDRDSEKLPSSIDLAIQGGVEDGSLLVFVSPSEDVPPESIDILVETTGSHEWFQLGHRTIGQKSGYDLHDQTRFNADQICDEDCSHISVKAFYKGKLMSQQEISR